MKYLFLLLFLYSCTSESYVNSTSSKIIYFKDDRTGLCFASVYDVGTTASSRNSLTCVPCDKVGKYLQ